MKEKIKEFFRPNKQTVITSIIVFIIGVYSLVRHFGESTSLLFPVIMFAPVFPLVYVLGPLTFLVLIPYSYVISCILSRIFYILKGKKIISILIIAFLLFISGFDAVVVNNTVNLPDNGCIIDEDCAIEKIRGDYSCVNSEWAPYSSGIERVLATSIIHRYKSCYCQQNHCEEKWITPEEATDYSVCHYLDFHEQMTCVNILRGSFNEVFNSSICDFVEESMQERCIEYQEQVQREYNEAMNK